MSGFDRNMSLEDLDFSVRTWKVLKRAGVRTLGDLAGKTVDDLLDVQGMGRKSLEEVAGKFAELGLELVGYEGDASKYEYVDKAVAARNLGTGSQNSYWAEIWNDFLESGADIRAEDGDILARVSIDGLKHFGDWENEDSGVIARVLLSKHGDVLVDYWHGAARIDAAAQEAICSAKEQLKDYYQEYENKRHIKGPRDYGAKAFGEGVDEFLNSSTDLNKKKGVAKEVYCLCEEFEDGDALREFKILAVSSDKNGLRKLMEAKISQDEYGFVKDKGVGEHEADHFITNFDCGFVEYYIRDQKVLSREELEHLVSTEVVSKHISEVAKGDQVLFDDCLYTASSDAYMTKTDNGREWNFEVEGEGPEEYLYASYFEGGIVTVARQYREVSLVDKIKDAEESVVRNSCQRSAGNVFER